jgi:hypothetical protein
MSEERFFALVSVCPIGYLFLIKELFKPYENVLDLQYRMKGIS